MRHLTYILLLFVLVACSGNDEATYAPIAYSDMPISLDVTTEQPSTPVRAVLQGIPGSNPWNEGDQFVVNAHYYSSAITTLAQQFMEDQSVTFHVTTNGWDNSRTTRWEYSPLKYWPQQGYVDFFAAYPKDYVEHNMDRQRLFHEDASGRVISTRFYLDKPIAGVPNGETVKREDGTDHEIKTYSDAIEQWDLMFSHRPHLSKPDVTTPVRFRFSHAEMAVRFFVRTLDMSSIGGLVIKQISLNNIHTGGTITAFDATDWQAYYSEFPGAPGIETSTAGATTPVRLDYTWDWTGNDPLSPDIRDTYTQTMDFVWYDGEPKPNGTQVNPGEKVFIIPPQCLGEDSGSSITVEYIITDIGHLQTYYTSTFNVDICGEPGKIVNIYLNLDYHGDTHVYEIEPITATLTPWEDVTGSLSTDLEQ